MLKHYLKAGFKQSLLTRNKIDRQYIAILDRCYMVDRRIL